MSRVAFLMREALINLRRNLLVVLGAVLAVFISLALAFGALVVNQLLRVNTLAWQDGVHVIAFLNDEGSDGVGTGAHQALLTEVQGWSEVANAFYVDKAQAWVEYKELFADRPDYLDIDPSVLPASVRIELNNIDLYRDVQFRLADQSQLIKRVVTFGEQIEQLSSLSTVLNLLGLGLAFVLGISAVILIANTIRMAIYAASRRGRDHETGRSFELVRPDSVHPRRDDRGVGGCRPGGHHSVGGVSQLADAGRNDRDHLVFDLRPVLRHVGDSFSSVRCSGRCAGKRAGTQPVPARRRGGAPGDERPAGSRAAVKPARLAVLLVALAVLWGSAPVVAQDDPATELQRVQLELADINRAIKAARNEASAVGQQVAAAQAHLEATLSGFNAAQARVDETIARVHETEQVLGELTTQLAGLEGDLARTEIDLRTTETRLEEQAVAMYMEASAMPAIGLFTQRDAVVGGDGDRLRRRHLRPRTRKASRPSNCCSARWSVSARESPTGRAEAQTQLAKLETEKAQLEVERNEANEALAAAQQRGSRRSVVTRRDPPGHCGR